MRILDNQRYWSFFKAYVICYVSLVGLFIVIDAFSNMDEFTKRADGVVEMSQVMGRFYLIRQSLFFDYLCGVIGMMAAIFTVTLMQRNNEQLAILAAGISTHRAIRPVLISSVIVSTFAVANQELIMPRYAEDLARSHDDDGQRTVHVSSRYDSRHVLLGAVDADRATKTLMPFDADIPPEIVGEMKELKGQQGAYIPPDHPTAPLKGGWLVRDATINPPLEDEAAGNEPRAHHAGRRPFRIPAAVYSPARPDAQAGPTDGKPAAPAPHSAAACNQKIASGPIPRSPISRRFRHSRCVPFPRC